jgi:hypothetical protein
MRVEAGAESLPPRGEGVGMGPAHWNPISEDANMFNFDDLGKPLYIYYCISYTIV